MKLALIFLFAFVVTSRQQIQHRVGHVWLSPYFPLQPILNNYASYPNYYNSYLENKDRFFPLLEPSSPNIHSIVRHYVTILSSLLHLQAYLVTSIVGFLIIARRIKPRTYRKSAQNGKRGIPRFTSKD